LVEDKKFAPMLQSNMALFYSGVMPVLSCCILGVLTVHSRFDALMRFLGVDFDHIICHPTLPPAATKRVVNAVDLAKSLQQQ